MSFVIWQKYAQRWNHGWLQLTPYLDLISLAVVILSLWFTVQKFYVKKLEVSLNGIGFIMTLYIWLILVSSTPRAQVLNVTYNHFLLLFSWLFCIIWSAKMTENNLSKLFISHWGEGIEEVEIQGLERDF